MNVFTAGLISRKQEEKMTILGNKVIQPWYMKPSLLSSHELYHQVCQVSLKDFFTHVSDITSPNLVIQFYLYLRIVGTLLRSLVRGVEIVTHKDNFREKKLVTI